MKRGFGGALALVLLLPASTFSRVDTEMFAPPESAAAKLTVDTEMFAPPVRATISRPPVRRTVDTEMFAPPESNLPRRMPPRPTVDTEMFAPRVRTARQTVDTEMFAPLETSILHRIPRKPTVDTEMFAPPERAIARRMPPLRPTVDTEMFAPPEPLPIRRAATVDTEMFAPEEPEPALWEAPAIQSPTVDTEMFAPPEELTILPQNPDDATGLPLFPNGENILREGSSLNLPGETAPPDTPRYRLQLAMEALQPVLPPLLQTNDLSLEASVRISVKRFVFAGNHVFSDRVLAKVVAPYAGRVITSEELEEARVSLTKHYVEAGYITSGAVLPDQDVEGGVIKFQIVEGRLTDIEMRGNKWFRGWWLRHQLHRAAGRPLNFTRLKLGLQLLRQNPTISRINAEVKPGARPGESLLEISVRDEQPFRFGFEISNKRPPSVSEGLGELYLTDVNLTGHNDPLELRWGLARWTKEGQVDYAALDNISGSYEVPVTPWGTTLGLHAAKSDAAIIDETFIELGITSRYVEYGASLRQPLYETLGDTVALTASAERKHSETFLLGQPFSLALGSIDGVSDVFATRLALDWVNRSQQHVLALRTVFSLGHYAFGSTRDDPRTHSALSGGDPARGLDPEIPDSKFFSWLFQAQFVDRVLDLPAWRKDHDTRVFNLLRETVLVLRANAQLADEPLLAVEQFSIGGLQSVRGYRENQLLRDNGVFASAELRVPLWLAKDKAPVLSLAPFFDYAYGWNVNKVDDQAQPAYSAGVGLLLNASKRAQVTLYWGHPFVDFKESKVSLQDYGIHFAVAISAF